MAYTLNDTSISITVDDSEYNRCMNSLSQTAEKSFQTIAKLAELYLSAIPSREIIRNNDSTHP